MFVQLDYNDSRYFVQLGEEPANDFGEVSVDATDDTATVDVPIGAASSDARPTHRSRPSSGSNVSVKSYHSADDVQLAHLAVGQRVLAETHGVAGTIRFLGLTGFAMGSWVGLELDVPKGKNDGEVKGERYFDCAPKYGLFCRPSQVRILDAETVRDLSKAHHAHKMYITRVCCRTYDVCGGCSALLITALVIFLASAGAELKSSPHPCGAVRYQAQG